jgi:UDP-glucose 4-epimerase
MMVASKRILVTGGAGFIGSHLVDVLLARGLAVRVLDNLSAGKRGNLPAQDAGLDFVHGDINDSSVLAACLQGVDAIVHLAAVVSVPASLADPLGTHQVNLVGTLNLLEAARKAGVRRFVYASSASVYGDTDQLPITEETPKRPLSPYAADKLAGEYYLSIYARQYGLSATAFRFFNIYGPRQDPHSPYSGVISIFASRVQQAQPVAIYGDGAQTRDFVFVKDLARILAEAVQTERLPWDVFNVGSGHATSLLDVLDALSAIVGREIPRQFQPPRAGDIRHSVADASRLCSTFSARVSTPLQQGLAELLAASAS